MEEIKFLKGTNENYDKLSQIDNNAIYITKTDDKETEIRMGTSVWSNDDIIGERMKDYVDEQIGDINKILEKILGENGNS